MPQLDKVTYLSQFFWLCFFFLGFYFSLVQFFLPKMARIFKFRQEKLLQIQNQSSSYLSETDTQQKKRWTSYLACLDIQKKFALTETSRIKEKAEEAWENSIALKSNANLHEAFVHEKKTFNQHMFSQNASIAYLFLIQKENPVNKIPVHLLDSKKMTA